MAVKRTALSEWAESERTAWALSAPRWKNTAYLTLGMSIGFLAGLLFSGFGG